MERLRAFWCVWSLELSFFLSAFICLYLYLPCDELCDILQDLWDMDWMQIENVLYCIPIGSSWTCCSTWQTWKGAPAFLFQLYAIFCVDHRRSLWIIIKILREVWQSAAAWAACSSIWTLESSGTHATSSASSQPGTTESRGAKCKKTC